MQKKSRCIKTLFKAYANLLSAALPQ